MRPLVVRVAHRGLSGLFPENTLLAFREAVACGVDLLELDVQLSRDGALVVMHDQTLERTTNGAGRLCDHTLAELRQLDAGRGERLPTLDEVLNLAGAASIRLAIEIKGADEAGSLLIAEALVAELTATNWLDRAIVTSFHPGSLLRARALQPRLPSMLDPTPLDGSLSPRAVCAQTLAAGANIVGYHYPIVTPALVAECRLSGLALWTWTPNTADEIRQQIQLGVQAVVTDRPDVLNEVLHDLAL
jgi:glycerophosphoryl diester phosphodiesterase